MSDDQTAPAQPQDELSQPVGPEFPPVLTDRRELLKRLGKFGAYAGPAVLVYFASQQAALAY